MTAAWPSYKPMTNKDVKKRIYQKTEDLRDSIKKLVAGKSVSLTTDTAGLAALQKRKQEEMKRLENSFLQNNDAELMSLCRQLASEIEARTSATLEVNRLKEVHQHESNVVSDQNQSLREQLQAAKEELERERKKAEHTENEARLWKDAFHGLTQAKQSTTNINNDVV